MTKYTNEQVEEITRLYAGKHLSSYQIATKLGISQTSVSRLMRKLGLSRNFALGIRLHYGKRIVPPSLPPRLASQRNRLISDYHARVHSTWQEYQERCNKPMSNAGRCKAHQDFLAQIKPDLENLFRAIAKLKGV